MRRGCRDPSTPIEIKKVVSVLPDDYSQLKNLPSINGIELSGNMSAESLNLLSSNPEDYEPITLSEASDDASVIVIDNGEMHRLSVKGLMEDSKNVKVSETLDPKCPIGTIQFVKRN